MANIPLQDIEFPGLPDKYTVPVVDNTLTTTGAAADAKKVGDEITSIKQDLSEMNTATSSDVGKALKAKTVSDGKVTEWEFGEAGGGINTDIYDIGDALQPYRTSNSYALTGTGLCKSDSNSQMVKYQVTAGKSLYLKLSADNSGVYQFQDRDTVNTAGASYVVGDPVVVATNSVVKVPDAATFLIVSQLKTNATNVVAHATNNLDKIPKLEVLVNEIKEETRIVDNAINPYSVSNNYALSGTGSVIVVDSNSQLLKYQVVSGDYLQLKLSADNACTYQWQNSSNVGQTSAIVGQPVSGAVDDIIVVPDGATWLIVSQFKTNTTNVVSSTMAIKDNFDVRINKNSDDIKAIKQVVYTHKTVDFTDYQETNGYINKDTNYRWSLAGINKCIIVPMDKWEIIRITARENADAHYAFLASFDGIVANEMPDYCVGYQQRYLLAANTSVTIDVPSDARFLYVLSLSGSGVCTPRVEYDVLEPIDAYALSEYKQEVSENLDRLWNAFLNSVAYGNTNNNSKDIPKNQGVRNAVKKILQMNNIQYTTKGRIPYTGGDTYRDVGATYTGLPYTIPVETQTMVGEDVTFETFMTAVNNPYSVLYTENINGAYSQSAIGNTYHGSNRGAYYGTMCSGLVWYALGMDPLQRYINYLVDIGKFEYVYDNSATGVQLMDVLLLPKHFAIVFDITRDSRGEPTEIIVKEAWAQTILTRVYDKESFNNRLGRTGRLGRYKDLYKNLEYTPSPFVAVGDEVIETPYVYNNDICTNYGDKAVINKGKFLGINYNLDGTTEGYTRMVVRKDGVDIQSYTLDANSHLINITSLGLDTGLYTAVLTDGTNESVPTYFEVAHAEVTSVSISGNMMTVSFAHDYGTPQYVRTCDIEGMPLGFYELTEDDIEAGECTFDYVKLYNTQFPEYTWPSQPYVRVCNVNTYGKMSSDMVPFNI